jgi:L,D-peptidoglycan transpeptidase YkuD (ErfK/YbiS/YcfS/YnhG family)
MKGPVNTGRTAVLAAIMLASWIALTALGRPAQADAFDPCASTAGGKLRYTTGTAQHLVFAISSDSSSNEVVVTECAKNGGPWQRVSVTNGRAGRNGFAEDGAKREGDGKSPTGSYTLSEAFGIQDPGTALPYRRLHDGGDCWGSTPGRRDYNQYYTGACRPTDEDLSAIMRSGSYRQAVVIDYNRPEVVDGRGSAVFLHVGGDGPTAACIAIPEPELRAVMRTLVAGDRIVMGPRAALFTL